MSLSEAAFGGTGHTQPAFPALRTRAGVGLVRGGFLARAEQALDAERGRWFLWLPVFFGCGIALYLGAPVEPPILLAVGATLLALALRMFFRATAFRLILGSTILVVALGFLTAKVHALLVEAPSLAREHRFTQLEGWVERVEPQEKRLRLTIRVINITGVAPELTPKRVRVSQRAKGAAPLPGDAIRTRATLMPPPEPAAPGAFDFGRYYWFMGLGGSGYVTGKIEPMPNAPPVPFDLRLHAGLAKLRQGIAARIGAVLDGDTGAIAKAMIMGDQGQISEKATKALRDSGLYHVISISGFHMALTAGTMFWLIRAVLALFPSLALRFPLKIWAGIGALAVATAYLAISGSAVAAVRSYMMVAIVFAAIILNRPALSQRNLAIAALLILIVMPQSLTDAGFQMSFAATAALIAYFESRAPVRRLSSWPAFIALPVTFLFADVVTTLLAGAAVDPFSAYHFHRIAVYSVLGNLAAMPAVSFIVMPMVMLALVAMPFGLEAVPLLIMKQGIEAMLAIAAAVAALPGAVVAVPAFSGVAFALIVIGGCWLIIWRGRWRYFGLAAIGLGLAVAPFGVAPDIWVEREANLVAIRDPKGHIATAEGRKATFSLERWMEADGDLRPVKAARGSKSFQCDGQSCIVLVKGKLVSHVMHPSAYADDCRRAAILIVNFTPPERCTQPEIVIDLSDLREKGAHTLRISEQGMELRTVAGERGRRPWSVYVARRETIPAVAPDKEPPSKGEEEKSGAESEESPAAQ
jgi:competence protein ComEC